MKKFCNFVCEAKNYILIIALLLLIPALIGYKKTKINYDILVYLPKEIETIKGQNILTKDFNMGSYSILITKKMDAKDILKLEQKIKKIKTVNEVASLYDVIGTTIPKDFLPDEILNKVDKNDETLIITTFKNGTSDEKTLNAVSKIKRIAKDNVRIGGMSSMVLDTMNLSNSEIVIYVVIAVILCLFVLMLFLDSYFVPFLLLGNIGIAILYNMGTNILLGDISYITKAISAVLQLGVTTDFSIFLYHKYESSKKKYKNKKDAMKNAIYETITAVAGSSLTTIAGFLALCAMTLTLGKDIGIVMAKGVLFGVICVITVFPALILTFDKIIDKTSHKVLLPSFNKLNDFIIKNYKKIFIVFIILIVPAYIGEHNSKVYYNLDKTLPSSLESQIANKKLKDEYNIVSPEMILVNKDLSNDEVSDMIDEIKNVKGIDFALSTSTINEKIGIPSDILDNNKFESDKYKMILINSRYETATNKLNNQIEKVNKIVKKYDKTAIVAGEGPLMKDLVEISDTDFKNVNYVSIIIIIIIMLFVLKSYSLPILLTLTIEFAIFLNMSVSYYTNTNIPFIASIVIGTIQLGATIDYAILMTTKYLEQRRKNDKFSSIKVALDNSVSSIFVSGMCFFAATFGVGIYSKLEMIASLCTLISRGAIISMITVIIILPSVLLIFDNLITKTTKNLKGDKNMKKKVLSLFIISLVSQILLIPNINALDKDETVYAKLKSNGDVKNITVSEHLINKTKDKKIEDITNLKNIKNLNGKEKFLLDNNNLTWHANKKDIYYQGSTTNELPISVKITYKLDGKELEPKKMLNKKGYVEITIKYTNNDLHYMNGKKIYTPFVLDLTTTLNTKYNSNISVTNGKVISTGTNDIITAIAAPGLYDSLKMNELKDLDTITISFDTTKFQTNSMYTVITPKVLDNTDLDKLNDLSSIYNDIKKLSDGTNKIQEGSNSLKEGTKKLNDGALKLKDELSKNIDNLDEELTDDERNLILEELEKNEELSDENIINMTMYGLSENEAYMNLKNQYNDGLEKYNDGINKYNYGIKLYNEGLEKYNNSLNTYNVSDELVNNCINSSELPYCSSIKLLVDAKKELNINKQTLDTNKTILDTSKNTLDSLKQVIDALELTAKQTALKTAKTVSKEVAIKTAENVKKKATNKTKDSLNILLKAIEELYDGTNQINNGANALYEGIDSLNNEGIAKLNRIVNVTIKSKVNTLKDLKTLSKNYNTFTMLDNNKEGSTKFIYLINAVK